MLILGFSVPSKYGATNLSPFLFQGLKIHLLGGSPERQLSYKPLLDIISLIVIITMKETDLDLYWTGKFNDTRWWRMLFDIK